MTDKHKPVMIPLSASDPAPHPADVAVIQDTAELVPMSTPSPETGGIWMWVLGLIGSTFVAILTLQLWDFAWSVAARNPYMGYAFLGLLAATALAFLIAVGREITAILRLSSLDTLKAATHQARLANTPTQAQKVIKDLRALYVKRPEMRQTLDAAARQMTDQIDGFAILDLAENTMMPPLDRRAQLEIERAARQVATVTALVPIPMADVAVALSTNIRMIRRIAQIYGGRGGLISSWRLLRAVMAHLVATGAVAVGDDWLGSIFGGGLLAKLSRRFGEGMINAALTARVGRAAIEVCRPMPFHTQKQPRVATLLQRAMTGVFDKSPDA